MAETKPRNSKNQKKTYQNNKKNHLLIIIPAVAVIAAAVIAGVLLFQGNRSEGAEQTAEKFMKAYCRCSPECANYIAYTQEHQSEIEEIKTQMQQYQTMADQMNIQYKRMKKKDVSEEDKKSLWDNYAGDIYVNQSDVSGLLCITMDVTLEAYGTKETQLLDVYVGKYQGKWKVIFAENFS